MLPIQIFVKLKAENLHPGCRVSVENLESRLLGKNVSFILEKGRIALKYRNV
jgi:hypothetical protein